MAAEIKPGRPFTMHLHRVDALSILVSHDGVEAHAVWLPKSQIAIAPERGGASITFTAPDWLVKEKDLMAQVGRGQGSLF